MTHKNAIPNAIEAIKDDIRYHTDRGVPKSALMASIQALEGLKAMMAAVPDEVVMRNTAAGHDEAQKRRIYQLAKLLHEATEEK